MSPSSANLVEQNGISVLKKNRDTYFNYEYESSETPCK